MDRRKFISLSLASIAATTSKSWSTTQANQDLVLLTPNSKSYAANSLLFNSRLLKTPQIIALCFSSTGVQQAVTHAQEKNFTVAIKSGGHCFEGYSSTNDGMMISLSEMNKLNYNDTDQTIYAQPGVKLAQLNDLLLPKGRLLPAGSCGGVGLGGLTLGGGYGLFSREFGLTCDHLLAADIVNAQGELIKTQNHPDLLKTLKGGGNGTVGVITSMKFITQTAPKKFTAKRYKFYNINQARALSLLKTWFTTTAQLPNDAFSAFVLNKNTLTILLTFSNQQTRQHTFDIFEPISKAADRQYKSVTQSITTALKPFYGREKPLPFKNASAGYFKNYAEIQYLFSDCLPIILNTPGMIYQINTLGGKINDSTFSENALYPHREYPYLAELQTYWKDKSKADFLLQRFAQIQAITEKHGINRHYRNYPDANFKTPKQAYYGTDGIDQMKKWQTILDPNKLFSSL